MKPNLFINTLILVILTSCGGGGGGGSSNPGDVSAFNPSIDSFSSSSYSLNVGGSVNLIWSTTNAISCTASGDWSGDKTNSDSPFNITLNEVKTYGFDDRFIRLWNYYLAYCESGFKTKRIGLNQIKIIHN